MKTYAGDAVSPISPTGTHDKRPLRAVSSHEDAGDGETVEGPGLLKQIVEDWHAHGRDWTRPGFQALAVHRFGNWRMGISRKLVRAPFSVAYRWLYRAARNFYGIELPYSARIGRRVVFEHQSGIVIHGNSHIGDDCTIRQGVTLGIRSKGDLDGAPRLGKGVDVGAGAKILGAITVGDEVLIGANAVVIENVPANHAAVGIPARTIARRDSSH